MTPQINAITFSGLVIVMVSIVVVGAIFSAGGRRTLIDYVYAGNVLPAATNWNAFQCVSWLVLLSGMLEGFLFFSFCFFLLFWGRQVNATPVGFNNLI